MSNRIAGYAEGLLAIARAEGDLDVTRSQLRDVAEAVAMNNDLRSSLSNNLLPAASRTQVVDDLLAGKATDTVRALVGMIVAAGRGGELGAIVDAFGQMVASASGNQMAVVRSAVPLTDEQRARLAQALADRAGVPIELENIVDPDVVGGAVTTIGDTVIDGSLRNKLNQMHEAL